MSNQLTPHAVYGIAYRLAMTAPARAAALKAKKVTPKGICVRVGLPNWAADLDMTAAEFSEFKATFTKGDK
jgi:hypothetical protein